MTDLAGLLATYGSPLYVYDLAEVRRAHAALREALPPGCQLHYSLKANPNPGLLRELGRLGCRAEVSSCGELRAATSAGVAAEHCLYTGPGKSAAELDVALSAGVRRLSVESPRDIARVAGRARATGTSAELLLRINPERPARGARLVMSGVETQFGSDLGWIRRSPADFAGDERAPIVGLHVYLGTNLPGVEALLESFELALEAVVEAARSLRLTPRAVDLGGGFGHPFASSEGRPDLASLRTGLEALLDARLPGWRRGEPAVMFESGRYLVAAAGTLVSTVEDVKTSGDVRYVVLDSGINHLGGLAASGRLLRSEPELVVARAVAPEGGDGEAAATRVAGPLCTPLDIRATRAVLPPLAPGSVVTIPNVGAYGLTGGLLGFLSRPCPVEVLVDGGRVVEASQLVVDRVAR